MAHTQGQLNTDTDKVEQRRVSSAMRGADSYSEGTIKHGPLKRIADQLIK